MKTSSRSHLIRTIIVLLLITPAIIACIMLVRLAFLHRFGYITEPVSVSGTGSMYPTFPKGEGKDPVALSKQVVGTPGMFPYPNGIVLFKKRYFNYQIGRGDIVVAVNDTIRTITKKRYGAASGLVKRVIALPGDSVQIRDGLVYVNDAPITEPYTARARSTFGGSFLPDCTRLFIPPHKYFLMGDNRKGSSDSRDEIGFVDDADIRFVLPQRDQAGLLTAHYRDTSADQTASAKISLDVADFTTLLNQKRKDAAVQEVRYQPKLELSAAKRGQNILATNDFSTEATVSGYTMEKAMEEANYSNIVWGEIIIRGYYDAQELVDNLFEFADNKTFFLDKRYQEVGVAAVDGSINSCPTQVIVAHLAGYLPPDYKKSDIASWKELLKQLMDVSGSWQQLKNSGDFYHNHKQDVDRINEIILMRVQSIGGVVNTMEANQWISTSQRSFMKADDALNTEQNNLSEKLNKAIQQ